MQRERRSRLVPIVKRVALGLAVKKGIDMYQESRRPQKRSVAGRLAKLGIWVAGGAGLFYAFLSGKLQPVVDKVMGASNSSGYGSPFAGNGGTSQGAPSSSGDGGGSQGAPSSSGDGQG